VFRKCWAVESDEVLPVTDSRVALAHHCPSVGPVSPFRGWSRRRLSPMPQDAVRAVPLLGFHVGFNLEKVVCILNLFF